MMTLNLGMTLIGNQCFYSDFIRFFSMKKLLFILLSFSITRSALAMEPEGKKAVHDTLEIKQDTPEKLYKQLIVAVEACNCSEVEKLIAAGADVNLQDSYGLTSLMRAAFHGDEALCKVLLSAGADVSATKFNYPKGADALWYAACCCHESAVALLIEYGASVPEALSSLGSDG